MLPRKLVPDSFAVPTVVEADGFKLVPLGYPLMMKDFDAYMSSVEHLKGLTSYEFICKCWTEEPKKFRLNPMHHTPGLNT